MPPASQGSVGNGDSKRTGWQAVVLLATFLIVLGLDEAKRVDFF